MERGSEVEAMVELKKTEGKPISVYDSEIMRLADSSPKPESGNGDLISKQAVLDAAQDIYKAAGTWLGEATEDEIIARAESCMATVVEMTLRVKKIPPAQPKITHEQAVEYLQSTGWMKEHDRQMMLDGVRTLTQRNVIPASQQEQKWIPVTEKKPPLNEDVLVSGDGYVWKDCLVTENGAKIWYHDGRFSGHYAWMPLPDPYFPKD